MTRHEEALQNQHIHQLSQLDNMTRAGGKVGQGVGFERTRRITGYLVGTIDRFNNAKRAEERDRVKHGVGGVNEP